MYFDKNKGYEVIFNDEDNRFFKIVVKDSWCKIGLPSNLDEDALIVMHYSELDEKKYYNLLDNKGYYVHIEDFVNNAESVFRSLVD